MEVFGDLLFLDFKLLLPCYCGFVLLLYLFIAIIEILLYSFVAVIEAEIKTVVVIH